MRVLVAEAMGMCFGVRDALKVLDGIDRPEEVTIHGQLVHNEVVLAQLGARGFHMVGEDERHGPPPTPAVMVTAHGVSDSERGQLEAVGKRIVDTTCPLVRRVHQAARALEAEGYHVLVVGRPRHVEVRGIVGDLRSFDVVPAPEAVRRYPAERLGVVCQTTTPPRVAERILAEIRARNPHAEVRFVDTVCHPTRNRQEALERLLPEVDAVVVVGGRDSNNTRELADLCRERGVTAHRVACADELRPEWFRGCRAVGLTAGTSTLDATIQEVRERLEELPGADEGPATEEAKSSQRWCDHFESNANNLLAIPWERGAGLTEAEKAALIPSIQEFQLGESSEGHNGVRAAAEYAKRVGDPEYVRAIRLFFDEEGRHARDLSRFLALAGAPLLKHSWADAVFRRLRRGVGLEVVLMVLLTAELIANVYYRALRDASRSEVLRRLCAQILRDERMHVRFHIERLRLMRRGRSRWRLALVHGLQRVLFAGACLVVWRRHGPALRLGGFGFRRFGAAAWQEMNDALADMTPARPRRAVPALR